MSEDEMAQVLSGSYLFDSDFYLSKCDHPEARVIDPVLHYIRFGAKDNYDPHPLFDTSFYKEQLPKSIEPDNPLVHYLLIGAAAGLNPHRGFDTFYYLSNNPDVKQSEKNPLVHYVRHGWKEGRRPNGWFDLEFYCECFPTLSTNPLEHYARFGATQEADFDAAILIRDSGLFDVDFYTSTQMGGTAAELGPIMHYIRIGAPKMLDPHPLFDTSYYVDQAPEVIREKLNPLAHFIKVGANRGLDPHPYFDTSSYRERYTDLSDYKPSALHHYLFYGAEESRNPNSWFDSRFYVEQYPEVALFGINPLVHYVRFGESEGRFFKRKDPFELSALTAKYYLALRQLEPLLPPISEFPSIPRYSYSKPCPEASAYLKLAKLIDKAFDYLLVVGNPQQQSTAEAVEYSLAQYQDKALVFSIDGPQSADQLVKRFGVRAISMEEVFAELAPAQRVLVLLRLIVQAQPIAVHNFESAICWHVFEKFHRAIKSKSLCYASLCDWRRDDDGVECGEFTRSFNACAEHLDKVFLPSENELERLERLYFLPESIRSKIALARSLDANLKLGQLL
jgi:hypothetical protein